MKDDVINLLFFPLQSSHRQRILYKSSVKEHSNIWVLDRATATLSYYADLDLVRSFTLSAVIF